MLLFPDIILPGILPTTLHGDHPLEELNFHLGSFVFVHATGFLKHCARPPLRQKEKKGKKKSVSWRNTVGSLTVWKARKDMTQSVKAAAAPRGSWETDVLNPSAKQSGSASSLTPVGRGLIPVEAIVQFLTGRRRNRVVLFQLWLCDSCMSTRIVRGHELLFMAETPFNSFVQCPEGRGEKKKIHWKRNNMTRTQSRSFVSCTAA